MIFLIRSNSDHGPPLWRERLKRESSTKESERHAKRAKMYTREFKVEAVCLLQTSQKSQAQIARELGVADSTLSQWRRDLAEQGNDASPGSGHQMPLEEENRHLKHEVEVLRQERDILKKSSYRISPTDGLV